MRIPAFIQGTWNGISSIATTTKNIVAFPYVKFINSDLWTKHGKPIYDYRIKPINKTDLLVFSGSLGVAAAIVYFALEKFGKPILAVASTAGAAVVLLSWIYTSNRISSIYCNQTWDDLDLLRHKIFNLTPQKKGVESSQEILKKIHHDLQFKPIPEDIVKELNNLPKEFNEYAKGVYKSSFTTYQNHLQARLDQLVLDYPDDEATLNEIKSEIEKIGTPDQDLKKVGGLIEKMKTSETLKKEYKKIDSDYSKLIKAFNKYTHPKDQSKILATIERIQKLLNRHRSPSELKEDKDTQEVKEELKEEEVKEEKKEEAKSPEETPPAEEEKKEEPVEEKKDEIKNSEQKVPEPVVEEVPPEEQEPINIDIPIDEDDLNVDVVVD